MGTLKIGWCPALDSFLADSICCGLGSKGFKEAPGDNPYWLIPRTRAVGLCEDLVHMGATLIWLGELPAP